MTGQKHVVLPSWPDNSPEYFWEPGDWGTSGIGMSKPRDADLSEYYGIKNKKQSDFRVYGLEKTLKSGEYFLPLRVCLEFPHCSIVIDRASHNMSSNTKFYDPETLKQVYHPSLIPVTAVKKEENTPDFFKEQVFPYGHQVSQIEKTIEEFKGMTLSELCLGGNHTLAVGWLVNSVCIFFREQRYVRLGTVSLDKKEIRRNLGRKCADDLDKLYVLAVEGGRYKK